MKLIPHVNKIITDNLFLDDIGLVGCRRRGRWSFHEEAPWSFVRGNALLAVIGEKKSLATDYGMQEFYTLYDNLLQFRGGPWNLDWTEDFYDLWSIIMVHAELSRTIIVVHENRGELDIKEVEVPEALDPQHRVEKMLAEYASNPPGRIPKSGQRAARICPHCPYKQRCDAEDILQGQQDDWSPTYPTP